MPETPQEYRKRMLGQLDGQNPLKIQSATPNKLERLLKGVAGAKLVNDPHQPSGRLRKLSPICRTPNSSSDTGFA